MNSNFLKKICQLNTFCIGLAFLFGCKQNKQLDLSSNKIAFTGYYNVQYKEDTLFVSNTSNSKFYVFKRKNNEIVKLNEFDAASYFDTILSKCYYNDTTYYSYVKNFYKKEGLKKLNCVWIPPIPPILNSEGYNYRVNYGIYANKNDTIDLRFNAQLIVTYKPLINKFVCTYINPESCKLHLFSDVMFLDGKPAIYFIYNIVNNKYIKVLKNYKIENNTLNYDTLSVILPVRFNRSDYMNSIGGVNLFHGGYEILDFNKKTSYNFFNDLPIDLKPEYDTKKDYLFLLYSSWTIKDGDVYLMGEDYKNHGYIYKINPVNNKFNVEKKFDVNYNNTFYGIDNDCKVFFIDKQYHLNYVSTD